MALHFEPNLITAITGMYGSIYLILDVIGLRKDIILRTTGENRQFYSTYENDTKPLLERRINTIFGASLIFISYLVQMLNTIPDIHLFDTPHDWWGTWSLLAILIGFLYFLHRRILKKYVDYPLKKTEKVAND